MNCFLCNKEILNESKQCDCSGDWEAHAPVKNNAVRSKSPEIQNRKSLDTWDLFSYALFKR